MNRNHKLLLTTIMALFCTNSAFALSIARPEPNNIDPVTGAIQRVFVERASHEFNILVAHACDYYNGTIPGMNNLMSTTEVLAILPSARLNQFEFLKRNASGKFEIDTSITLSNVFRTDYADPSDPTKRINLPSGPLNNLRLSTNDVFTRTRPFWQTVSPYAHHGRVRDVTVSAAHWSRGSLPGQFYTDLKFRASTATLVGCVRSVQVMVPTWQICGQNDYTSFSSHPNKLGTNDFTPNFTIIRNEIRNPYPTECATDRSKRLNLVITPTVAFIDRFLNATRLPGDRTPHSFAH